MLPPLTRFRTSLLWVLFALAAIATGLAVHRLYQTAREEIAAQSERALDQEQARVLARVQTYTDNVRRSTLVNLVSFHVDGLNSTLRQWDESNDIVLGTFLWDPVRGFAPDLQIPTGGPNREELVNLWREFREWRAAHPTDTSRAPSQTGFFQTIAYRTFDNPALPATELGYQGENLDILTHAGRRIDPWAGWAGSQRTPGTPWVFWYQAGPDDVVRGCFVNTVPLVSQLRSEFTDRSFAQVELVEEKSGASSASTRTTTLSPWLPAQGLTATPGEIFLRKESDARFTALITALLFGLFLTGGAALTARTRRESREAGRKITFVAQVSHELRTPLTSIRMFADMLATPGLPETKRTKFAQTISTESQRLEQLIERLLAFNTLERGAAKITRVPIDVAAITRETIEEMNSTLGAAGLKAEMDLPAGPVVALADHSSVKQALLNLLDNAIKYAREGGLVRIKLTNDSANVRLTVADDGLGIPRAIHDRLFEPFVQGGQTLTNKSPGVGLGLSIARGMLRQAGGDLVLLNSITGATFEIRLQKSE